MKLTLRNYRSFAVDAPVTVQFGPGITALTGPNNAGKTNIFRFFRDFGKLLPQLKTPEAFLRAAKGQLPWDMGPEVRDPMEVFRRGSRGPIIADIQLPQREKAWPQGVRITITPKPLQATIEPLDVNGDPYKWFKTATLSTDGFSYNGSLQVPRKHFDAGMEPLHKILYLPPIRHISGAASTWYDLPLGSQFSNQWRQLKQGNSLAGREAASLLEREILPALRAWMTCI